AFIATGKPPDDLTGIYNFSLVDPVNFTWGPLRPTTQPFENDNMNFAPRVGFAYTADNQGNFAVRGGFGVNFSGFDGSSFETASVGSRGVKFNLSRTFHLVDRVTGIRPNPNDIQGTYLDNSQPTNYNSWQTSLKQRFKRGLAFNVHYTWGQGAGLCGGRCGR